MQRLSMDVGMPSTGCIGDTEKVTVQYSNLVLYDPNARTTVSADASSHGLEVVLLQEQANGNVKPVSYISRSLSPTEKRYAQIEKEALAFTWACERFSDFIVSLNFSIETDHNPLTSLFSTKYFEELPV